MRVSITLFIVLIISAMTTSGQTTEFTYQGNLKLGTPPNTVPAQGSYDFEFRLYDADVNGNQFGATIARNAVAVDSGSFSVKLDFGGNFPGTNRYLAISVRQTGGGSFQPLSPRQQISSAPYSVRSASAGNADNASQLGGFGPSGFILNSTNLQGANFNISGNGSIGGTLTVQGMIQSNSGVRFADATVQSTNAVLPSFSTAANNTVALPNYPDSPSLAVLHLDLPTGAFLLIATVEISNGANFFGQNNERSIVCSISNGDFLAYHWTMGGLTHQTITIHSYRNAAAGAVDVKCETEFAPANPTTGVSVIYRRMTALRFAGGISG